MSNVKNELKKGGIIYQEESKFLNPNNIRLFILLGGILIMLIAQCIVSPNILKNGTTAYSYLVKIILAVESTALIACGVTFVVISGKNDLSTGVMMQFGASVACIITTKYYGMIDNTLLAILSIAIPIVICMLMGMVNGILVGVFGLNAFVTTLGTAYIIQAVHVLFNGGGTVYPKLLSVFQFVGKGRIFGKISFPVIMLIFMFILWGFVLHKTTFGRKIFSVGGNPLAARFSGIDSRKMIIFAYMIAGTMAGLAGVFIASYTASGDMLMGVGKEFDAIIAVVIGGALLTGGSGSMIGTAIGCLFLGILQLFYVQFNVNINVQWVIRGSLMLAVILMNSRFEKEPGGKKA